MNYEKETLIKNIRKLAITKQLSFLIGSGTSVPAVPLMDSVEGENLEERNENLKNIVKQVSTKMVDNKEDRVTGLVLNDYVRFITSIINILNLSNSRQTPKTINLFSTNYDLFIEKAVDVLMRTYKFVFNDGASGYFNRILDSSNYNKTVSYKGLNDNYTNEIPSITLIKPHGSINWEIDKDRALIRNYVTDSPLIVRPTGKEENETFMDNHFHEMLRVFQLELDKPQSVLFVIGFSFQDSHIAKMVRRAIQNPELIVYIFGFNDDDEKKILNNLKLGKDIRNLILLTPKDFNENYKNNDNFTLSNLTDILNGSSLEDLKDDQA
ncbi:SIR2 family protein [Companilactobacillus sp. FL22-1]|uniref:SIR2 family protein n=1 Tax=Companilactobacillus sp. FL22-1 TaxID=3373892 RepID=UPI00375403D0